MRASESSIDARPAPVAEVPTRVRLKRTWFPSPAMGVFSLLLAAALLVLGWRLMNWGVLQGQWSGTTSASCANEHGACWAFVLARWKPWLVGNYPDAQLWRAWVAFGLLAAFWSWAIGRPANAPATRILLGFVLLPL